jgi:hypothetical protein
MSDGIQPRMFVCMAYKNANGWLSEGKTFKLSMMDVTWSITCDRISENRVFDESNRGAG